MQKSRRYCPTLPGRKALKQPRNQGSREWAVGAVVAWVAAVASGCQVEDIPAAAGALPVVAGALLALAILAVVVAILAEPASPRSRPRFAGSPRFPSAKRF